MNQTKIPSAAAEFGEIAVETLLKRWRNGDETALASLNQRVFSELRKLAGSAMRGERPDHTLQPTALVNEVFLRLTHDDKLEPQSRTHFFGIAAHLMRQVLIQHARQRGAIKRGGAALKVALDEQTVGAPRLDVDALALHQALESLARLDARQVRIVELRYFAGFSVQEVAAALDISPATVKREWATAKVWLYRRLQHEQQRD